MEQDTANLQKDTMDNSNLEKSNLKKSNIKKANLENPAQMAMCQKKNVGRAVVKSVEPNSIADDCGLQKGDIITKISGQTFKDILDFKFLTSDDYFTVEVEKTNGEYEEIEVYNDMYEQFGVEFENALIDKPMLCKNKCIFCFMDQLPKNVRKTMVFKDDDVRLSFLQGNYATLTNLNDDDISRLIKLRVSPINISVHCTNGEVRKKMLNNPNADKLLDIMYKFADNDIIMNAQIVLCKGINDGELLKQTLSDLANLYPSLASVSIVPVGLSKYRKNLYELKKFTKQDCINVINDVELYQDKFLKDFGTRLVYLADEFYLEGRENIPNYEYYDDFPQIENGVGLVASLKNEIICELNTLSEINSQKDTQKKAIATSYIAYDFIKSYVDMVKQKNKNVDVEVFKIKNNFFGENITVTGLLCGGDIIEQLKNNKDFKNIKTLLLSDSMFKEDTDLFLDDTHKSDVERELNVKVKAVENTGAAFIDALLN